MDLSVARAVFTSALLRSDPPAPDISRDNATLFTKTLLKTLNLCTASDVKVCKSFVVRNILASSNRTAALSKYLITIAKSCSPRQPCEKTDTMRPSDENEGLGRIVNGKLMQPPDPSFKRLHVLFVMHDVLAHVYGRLKDADHVMRVSVNDAAVDEHVKPAVLLLAELAACSDGEKTLQQVNALVDLWSGLAIFDPRGLPRLRQTLSVAAATPWSSLLEQVEAKDRSKADEERRRREDETKWMLPKQHGVPNDSTAAWDDLPAANGLYQKRTSGYPLRANQLPPGGYFLKNGGMEADPELRRETLRLHQECLKHFDKYTNPEDVTDVDALGGIVWRDPERPTRNYWGWSYEGIAKRKQVAAESVKRLEHMGVSRGASSDDDPVARARALAMGTSGFVGGPGSGMERSSSPSRFRPSFDQGYGGGTPGLSGVPHRGGRGGGFRGDLRGNPGRGRGWRGGRW